MRPPLQSLATNSSDPKGIYRQAREGAAKQVPGIQVFYEPPERPDVVIRGDHDKPEEAARRVIAASISNGFLHTDPSQPAAGTN
jgi:adenylylsulfate kinase-like enzyme